MSCEYTKYILSSASKLSFFAALALSCVLVPRSVNFPWVHCGQKDLSLVKLHFWKEILKVAFPIAKNHSSC